MDKEFQRLLDLFSLSQEGKHVDVNEVLKEAVVFFDHLKDVFKTGSDEDKKEMVGVMNTMYSKLLAESDSLVARSGLTQEQMEQYCENPQNFSKEQWEMIGEARKKMLDSGFEISRYLQGKGDAPSKNKDAPKRSSGASRRDKWMRS